jgi:hypothetical protein
MYGVAVHDNDTITGEIVNSQFGTLGTMRKECGLDGAAGCAKAHGVEPPAWPAADGKYDIWYSDNKCVPEHEWCHAAYEQKGHTTQFMLRSLQGSKFAACP